MSVHWKPWTEANPPPVDRPFLAWFGKDEEPWCGTLNAADDGGFYFMITGTGEAADAELATHWAPMPEGPR